MNKQAITEEQGVHKQWYEEAKIQTLETLPAFLAHLSDDYQHDYGTYVHMTAAAALGAAHAAGTGLSGFQAGCVMWQFLQEWSFSSNKCGLRIIDYDNILYPQYADAFAGQTLTEAAWAVIRKEARARILADAQTAERHVGELAEYETELAAFKLAHPDYDERPEHYLPLSCGTGDQWQAEEAKKASGFVFAPREPYLAVAAPAVAQHWASMAMGCLPFGMRLAED